MWWFPSDPLTDVYSDDDLQRSCEDLWLPHRVEGGGEDRNLDQDGVGDQDYDGDGDDGDDGDGDGDDGDGGGDDGLLVDAGWVLHTGFIPATSCQSTVAVVKKRV